MVDDNIKITGSLEIILRDQFGNIKDTRQVNNLVVTAGKTLIASRLVNASDTVPSHMAVGTSTTAAAAAQTALIAEVASGGRQALGGTSRSANVITYSATFAEGQGTGALTEAGIFNASSGGTMLCRTVFSVVNKDVSDTLTINWNVTIN